MVVSTSIKKLELLNCRTKKNNDHFFSQHGTHHFGMSTLTEANPNKKSSTVDSKAATEQAKLVLPTTERPAPLLPQSCIFGYCHFRPLAETRVLSKMDIFSFCTTQNFFRKSELYAGFTLDAVIDTSEANQRHLKKILDFTLASVPRNRHVLNLFF